MLSKHYICYLIDRLYHQINFLLSHLAPDRPEHDANLFGSDGSVTIFIKDAKRLKMCKTDMYIEKVERESACVRERKYIHQFSFSIKPCSFLHQLQKFVEVNFPITSKSNSNSNMSARVSIPFTSAAATMSLSRSAENFRFIAFITVPISFAEIEPLSSLSKQAKASRNSFISFSWTHTISRKIYRTGIFWPKSCGLVASFQLRMPTQLKKQKSLSGNFIAKR